MQKQNPLFMALLVLCLALFWAPAEASEDALHSIRQLANQIYISAQDMVSHGEEGHAHEIVSYGKKMIERGEMLLDAVSKSDTSQLREKKAGLSENIQAMLKKTKEAVALGEAHETAAAMIAARKALFQAKQARQKLQSIR